ncbi:aromatase/cyclase [Amycolatopsis sp. FBCC-B4732]|uniref:Putative cyclase n=1 Tax=Amycolatopsis orientalis subsp. vinearia TaxID=797057 RepID=D7RFJ9_AMYOR|nr:aromatase/cyclase [Amycolatopsis sp. FBCC-B4732]ADI71447.1 putative cyclase [Amycolatopsis orientalis subsp. vinearia]UOX84603.1 aromatase/cyclase [Amycolatopsis sp. FBCC-B4732]
MREAEHDILVDAPADEVYRLVAEVANWPRIFPPTVFVDHVERGEGTERIRIWATANGEPKNWTSRRELDPAARRISFHQEVSTPPVAEMSGTWIVEPVSAATAKVRLLHAYRAVGDDPGGLAWIDRAVDTNSRSELAALKHNVELVTNPELTFSFTDTVRIDAPAKDVYDFVDQAALWAERLPHVSSVDLREPSPGLQVLRMDTRAKDGSVHTTESVRVCFPHHRIVYKQTTLPALMTLHTGRWDFAEEPGGGTTASSEHTVVLNTANIAKVLGAGAGVAEAREFVRTALSTNSRATLGFAKDHAEARP